MSPARPSPVPHTPLTSRSSPAAHPIAAVADFDDPNLDKDAVVLGEHLLALPLSFAPLILPAQRMTLPTPRSGLPSPTLTTRTCP